MQKSCNETSIILAQAQGTAHILDCDQLIDGATQIESALQAEAMRA
jgi:hypothetical protein